MLNWRGLLPNAAIQFTKMFNRTTASSSSCSSKLFISGLSYDTNETTLKDAFSQYGDVIEVKVICHPTTGKSKGYGFVKFSSENEAAAALQKMNGEVLDERNIWVHYANSG
ncbi:glycine-rich RNA-binding protein 2, mitochondrial-like isoform X3 [Phragmites australis]|uniref:glycine-rich RNA-binding protein 2, mitochondrial-like isoform X3 n=1 Tax=Phragmites australis TaxID=29695 RepID=UPI002D79E052|nr:glycine-rich RNA-binding protein 2, mitochondrial-like isoform X3 [Phragmites australis]XP_062210373.1 glycine-rich RNA-binding protein 2, mitochondrial-like isoform X3 [Phragmites australis]XP_062210374.1 glycine-rich RNA-binding protein 2, mitochondrial-like isoform X3 [Phragmites australis]